MKSRFSAANSRLRTSLAEHRRPETANGSTAIYHDGAWEIGTLKGSQLMVDGVKVVGSRGAAIAAPAAGTTIDSEARSAIGEILAALRLHGLIAM